MQPTQYSDFLSGLVVGCGRPHRPRALASSDVVFYLLGSAGIQAVAFGLLGLVIGVLHPRIPEQLGMTRILLAIRDRFLLRESDSLQRRCRTISLIWIVALVFVIGVTVLPSGYALLLGRIQSPEFASVAVALLGLFSIGSVLVLAAPFHSALGRAAEYLVRRRTRLTFLVHPWLNLGLASSLGVFWVIAQHSGQSGPLVELPWISILISVLALLFTWVGGEWVVRASQHLPTAKKFQLGVLVSFAVIFLTLIGLRAPTARQELSETRGMNRFVLSMVRAPFDQDGDGYAAILNGGDCDDTDPNIHPGAIDIAGNTIDENCVGGLEVLETKPKNDDQVVLREIGLRPPYSFVVITVDGLRADHVGFYGYGRETTPAIDDMASDSVVFNNAYSTSGDMAASLASMFSSRYPSELVRTLADGIRYERSNDFLSEQLARSGFHTAAFPSHAYFSGRTGLSQGFALWQPYRISAGRQPFVPTSETVVTSAIEHLGRLEPDRRKPFFLWLHIVDPQPDYLQHLDVQSFGPSRIDRYDHEVRYVDTWLAQLFAKLKERQDWAESLVLVLAGTRGANLKDDGKNRLDEATLKVPFMIRVPGMPPRPVEERVSMIDLMPTILDLADARSGAEPASDKTAHGKTLIAQMIGKRGKDAQIYAEIPATKTAKQQWVWLDGGMKLHYGNEGNLWSLYDIGRDPLERLDLADKRPQTTERMQTALRRFRSALAIKPVRR